MGTKYSTNATSGYNTLPPSDDGTVSEANKVKWATLKTKLADPIKTLADTINSELVTHFNNGPSAVTANTTLGASHYNQVIQASGTGVTLTLSDAATLLAGWYCWVRNTDTTESITIGRATAGDTFNGTAANYLLQPNEAIMIVCNAAANGFITTSLALGESQTLHGTTPQLNFRETDQTLPAGKVRIYANGDTWQVEKNTATAGDYSTSIKSLKVLTNGVLETEGSTPWLSFYETDQTLPAGKFRLIGSGDTLALQKNTATAGDYSTSISSLMVGTDGAVTFAGQSTGAGAAILIDNAAPVINFRESDQTLPAGQFRIAADANTWRVEKNTATAGDYSTNIQSLLVNANGTVTLYAGSVAQAALKTTTAAGNLSAATGTSASYTLTGGTYSWWTASGSVANEIGFDFSNADTAAGVIGVHNGNATTRSFYVDERYVQASPPYNWGPCFVFLALDALGNIKHSRVSNDPPWAYHGPTDITPQHYRNGRSYRVNKLVDGVPLRAALKNGRDRLLNGTAIMTEQEVEITLDYKDSDKIVMPHWFVGNDLTGLTVVMLEPGTNLMQRFADLCDDGGAREVLHDVLLAGRLNIGNTSIGLPGAPPGVMCVPARLK